MLVCAQSVTVYISCDIFAGRTPDEGCRAILCKKIQALRPDLIAVTGDLVDHAPYQHAMAFMKHVSKLCPVYYVRGNHECLAGNYEKQELLLHSFASVFLTRDI